RVAFSSLEFNRTQLIRLIDFSLAVSVLLNPRNVATGLMIALSRPRAPTPACALRKHPSPRVVRSRTHPGVLGGVCARAGRAHGLGLPNDSGGGWVENSTGRLGAMRQR